MADRILVGYDGSDPSAAALEYALETFPEATITALYVVQIPAGTVAALEGPELRLPLSERGREHATDVLEGAIERAAERGRDLETEIATGKPDHRLVEHAVDEGYDTIVVGSHGRDGVSRLLLGTVAESVVRRAPMPVVVVR
ncbi:universal stress protein [Natronorubrum texcoconense]|uniref:Nucleotide-binding universal stress protein, UspA family n=1 Tax=Natronorubrum texcoconense TaxID=1095776 RepID=A0A1G8XK34_9EURY|nr:universal stress protein [Natronorubrum texcoconense]SDJ90949.1 Nucleotide-binding universal stress protein, UspA family [Natronorubrum texcoconense]